MEIKERGTINKNKNDHISSRYFLSSITICSSLTTVNLPKCLSVETYAFWSNASLSIVSLPKCVYIGSSAFRSCYNLISLYLTSVTAVPTLGANAFTYTPISTYSSYAGQYGSVYVSASLYSDFISASYWSAISARIVSVSA